MPPKAPPPASSTAASKGKGKEAPAAVGSATASSSTTASNAASSTPNATPAATAGAAAQRRQPIGKVIHYFADNQSQGYDGMAFQEAYKTQVLAKIQEMQDAKQNEPPSADEVNVKDEDVQALMSLTGLKKEQAKEYFNKARSTKVEDACRAYLHPEKYQTLSSSTTTETQTNGSTGAVSAAA